MNFTESGQQIIALLTDPKNLKPSIFKNKLLTAEDNSQARWKYFVKFPRELAAVFPGSYISPKAFIRELGMSENIDEDQQRILGSEVGTADNPALRREPLLKGDGNNFSLTVLNGLTNEHALAMTKFAFQGFDDPGNRAQYQQHMFETVAPFINNDLPIDYGIRIFDDCIASGDSIAGYLYKLHQKKNPLLDQGVEICAVTATAQSILFLRSFAKMLRIDLTIKVGHLAFGLTQGIEKENKVREHANYITYPKELLRLIDNQVSQELNKYQIKIGEEEVIQVVGDMGEAEKGIKQEVMDKLRNEIGNDNFCWWNDTREDAHGEHNNKKDRMEIPLPIKDGRPVIIYLARGGYLPYEWDRKLYPHFGVVNKIIKRASRLWTKELGYGVGIKNED